MATATHLRDINGRKVIHAMLRLRTASRSELAREAALSKPTVGRIVDQLLAESILAEPSPDTDVARPPPAHAGPLQLGRPSRTLELDRRRRRFLAVQVGVRETRVAALPMAVSDTDDWQVRFPTPTSARAFQQALRNAVAGLRASAMQACVVSLPGVVDERAGRVLLSPNLRWTEKADVPAIMGSVTRSRVVYIQEIRALALGQLAADPMTEDFLLVDSGSGVGAAACVGGRLYAAPLPLSGELGHTPVVGNERPCSCGAVGCVETLASRGGLLATSAQHGGPDTWPALVGLLRDGVIPAWLAASLDAVAITIAGGLNLLGVRQVLLSGALAESPAIVNYLRAAVRRASMWGRFGEIRCRPTKGLRMLGMVSLAIDGMSFFDPV